MDAAYAEVAPQRSARLRLALRGVGLSLALAAGFVGGRFEGRWHEMPEPSKREEHLVDTATVLVSVQQLARLETVAYHMERVIDLKQREARMFGLVNVDDAILLIAVGDVVAGVDLSNMRAGDVLIERDPAGVASVR